MTKGKLAFDMYLNRQLLANVPKIANWKVVKIWDYYFSLLSHASAALCVPIAMKLYNKLDFNLSMCTMALFFVTVSRDSVKRERWPKRALN